MIPLKKPLQRKVGVGLDIDEERALARRWRVAGDVRARARLIEVHIGLAKSIANEYRHDSRVELEDLMSAALEGLVRAVDRYDPNRGTRFSTYSSFWIRSLVLRHIIESRGCVTFSKSSAEREVFWGMKRAREMIESRGEEVTAGAIASELSVPEAKVEGVLAAVGWKGTISLDDTQFAGHGAKKPRTIVFHEETPESLLGEVEEEARNQISLMQAIEGLHPSQRLVIKNRLAGKTLADTAREVGVSRERVRQIQVEALAQLKRRLDK